MHMKTIHGGMMWLECNFANQSSKHNLSTIVYSFYGVSNHWIEVCVIVCFGFPAPCANTIS